MTESHRGWIVTVNRTGHDEYSEIVVAQLDRTEPKLTKQEACMIAGKTFRNKRNLASGIQLAFFAASANIGEKVTAKTCTFEGPEGRFVKEDGKLVWVPLIEEDSMGTYAVMTDCKTHTHQDRELCRRHFHQVKHTTPQYQ